ncbi:DUF3136 domain-containing protein [Synechococcus sp. RSCCF101]|uniref:DUF3136 domain-containing protein n=1 Tax=Synechococcus sp. RSCCF101 TaxID=2511069 RepID=UPI001CD9A86A
MYHRYFVTDLRIAVQEGTTIPDLKLSSCWRWLVALHGLAPSTFPAPDVLVLAAQSELVASRGSDPVDPAVGAA